MTRSVLLVTPVWARDGGVAAHVAASAAALARAGVDVHVLVARRDARQPAPEGVLVHVSPQLFKAEVAPERRIGEETLSGDYWVIHTHQFDEPAVLERLRRGAPLLSSVHGFSVCTSGVHYFRPGEECQRAHGPGCAANLALRGCAHTRDPRWLPASYRRATRARASLRASDLAISYSTTIDRHLAINGVQRRAIVPLFSTIPLARGSGHERRRRVVFAGRLVHAKGVDVLIRAARAVEGEFVICGEGRGLAAMRRLARRLGVGERVRFAGWLAPDRLAPELADASVVAIPSRWPEPFGLVGVEAHAAGRPVIASATGGVGDWLADGRSGILVPPGDVGALADALSQLLSDPERQARMGLVGQRNVSEHFTERHHVDALLHAYRTARATWERDAVAVG